MWFGGNYLKIVCVIGFAKIIVWSVTLPICAPNVLMTSIISTLFRILIIIFFAITAGSIACLVQDVLLLSVIAGLFNSASQTRLILILTFDFAYPS
jgi:hypothetical protein